MAEFRGTASLIFSNRTHQASSLSEVKLTFENQSNSFEFW